MCSGRRPHCPFGPVGWWASGASTKLFKWLSSSQARTGFAGLLPRRCCQSFKRGPGCRPHGFSLETDTWSGKRCTGVTGRRRPEQLGARRRMLRGHLLPTSRLPSFGAGPPRSSPQAFGPCSPGPLPGPSQRNGVTAQPQNGYTVTRRCPLQFWWGPGLSPISFARARGTKTDPSCVGEGAFQLNHAARL